jgi:hypothetical protein
MALSHSVCSTWNSASVLLKPVIFSASKAASISLPRLRHLSSWNCLATIWIPTGAPSYMAASSAESISLRVAAEEAKSACGLNEFCLLTVVLPNRRRGGICLLAYTLSSSFRRVIQRSIGLVKLVQASVSLGNGDDDAGVIVQVDDFRVTYRQNRGISAPYAAQTVK